MRTLAHISDTHFGRVIPEVAEGLLADLETLNPDLVVISGDLTQRARNRQYRDARRFLARIPFHKVVVPGNHDVPLYDVGRRFLRPLKRFQRYITADLAPFYADDEIAVLGINTARSLTWKNGRISIGQVEIIRERFRGLPDSVRKILVTHHPFLPPPDDINKALVGRAAKVLEMVERCNLDLLLAGHFHKSYAGGSHSVYRTLARSVLVIQAGTATSSRIRREANAFNIITIRRETVQLDVRMWIDGRFRTHRREAYTYDPGSGWNRRPAPINSTPGDGAAVPPHGLRP